MFSDHAVFQRERPIPVWGWADPGERVQVSFGGTRGEATADSAGRWRIDLPARGAGGPSTLTVTGRHTVLVRDVLVGEVWIASGQSNMAFALSGATTASADIPNAADDGLRLLTVPQATSLKPLEQFPARWAAATPDTVRGFSAVAYYFARELRQKLGVPVGLIHTSWPGTQAEEWTDPASLRSDGDFRPIPSRWDAVAAETYGLEERPLGFDLVFRDFRWNKGAPVDGQWTYTWDAARLTAFERAGSTAKLSGQLRAGDSSQLKLEFGTRPGDFSRYTGLRFRLAGRGLFKIHVLQPTITDWDNYATQVIEATPEEREIEIPFSALRQAGWGVKHAFTPQALTAIVIEPQLGKAPARPPSGLYNAMISPLVPYAIRGAIWYQGEGNSGRSAQYRKLLPAMIRGWRAAWGEGDFPFLIVQLPNYRERKPEPGESGWAELREAQLKTLELPATGLAVTIDLGEAADVHPHNKRPVGERLARWALGTTYGLPGVYSGPIYRDMVAEGSRIRIRFRERGGSLASLDGGPLRGFAIAGEDRRFVPAGAVIDGGTVLVHSDSVPHPVAVRYAWADNPDCNLGNANGLPASPFRTDSWPGITEYER